MRGKIITALLSVCCFAGANELNQGIHATVYHHPPFFGKTIGHKSGLG